MKLEKLFTVFMLLIIALTVAPLAFADGVATDNVTNSIAPMASSTAVVATDVAVADTAVSDVVDNSLDAEVAIMNTPYGAQVRLIQLEASLERNILSGEDVIARITENHPDFDASILNGILDELRALEVEVQAVDIEGSADELAQSFVEIKADAIELSKEFRSEVVDSNTLSKEDKEQLRTQAKEKVNKRITAVKEKLTQARNHYNAQKAKSLMKAFGAENNDLVEKIQSGEMTLAQVKEQLRASYKKSSSEEKTALRNQVKEAAMKRRVFQQSTMDRADEMIQNRIQLRESKMNDLRAKFSEHMNRPLEDGPLGDGMGGRLGSHLVNSNDSDGEE